jgi:hypothetical protein
MTEGRSNCHPIERERSDQDLLDDEPLHSVAARTGFSIAVLHRHDSYHVGTAIVEQNETKVATDVESSLKCSVLVILVNIVQQISLQHLCSRNVSERSPDRIVVASMVYSWHLPRVPDCSTWHQKLRGASRH